MWNRLGRVLDNFMRDLGVIAAISIVFAGLALASLFVATIATVFGSHGVFALLLVMLGVPVVFTVYQVVTRWKDVD